MAKPVKKIILKIFVLSDLKLFCNHSELVRKIIEILRHGINFYIYSGLNLVLIYHLKLLL